jgi:diphthamide synthase (EF-2-diphthine--ammonia ligase)
VRRELLHAQAEALGLPLTEVWIPWPCPNETYEARMRETCLALKEKGMGVFAFGDLFLEEVRQYRERNLAALGLRGIYPLWGLDTSALAQRFIADGFRACLCCIDTGQIAAGFAGRDYDASLLKELPEGADPCGENGEFHTFVYDGPIFSRPIPCARGEVVIRDSFAYCDLHLQPTDELCA